MKPHTRPPGTQRGAALIISLIFLVLITLIGVASLRGVVLEEKMVSNQFDRSLAFQAAEAALRSGEAFALAQSQTVPPHQQGLALALPTTTAQCSTTCSGGLCSPPNDICEKRWSITGFTGWVSTTGFSLTTQAGSAPQYYVEFLGNDFPCNPADPSAGSTCGRYRITARSQTGTDRAEVLLQSIYATN